MSITSRSLTSLGAKILVGATALAGGFVGVPAGTSHAAYNAGVKSLDFAAAVDTCLPGQWLPCTPGAGQGESNTLRVTQSLVGGYNEFSGLESNSSIDNHIWLGASFGAECRRGYSLFDAEVSNKGGSGDQMFAGSEVASATQNVSIPNARTMPVKQIALNWEIDSAFDAATQQAIFDYGEDVIADRIAAGMSASAARALAFEAEGSLLMTGEVVCRGNGGLHYKYVKWYTIEVPLTIEFEGVDVAPPARGQVRPGGGLTMSPEVTDVALSVVPDPADPCTVHLSGVIQTNGETSVDYRFLAPNGQRSSVYTVEVDPTHTAFVNLPVDVPSGPAAQPHQGGITDEAGAIDTSVWSGAFTIEVISPNHESAADGFSVPYCSGPQM
jgi:hypothetical protein